MSLRLQQPVETARDGEPLQDRVRRPEMPRPIIDLLETVDVDHEGGRPDVPYSVWGNRHDSVQPVEEQFPVGQTGQIVVDGVVEQALLRPFFCSVLVDPMSRRSEPLHHRSR